MEWKTANVGDNVHWNKEPSLTLRFQIVYNVSKKKTIFPYDVCYRTGSHKSGPLVGWVFFFFYHILFQRIAVILICCVIFFIFWYASKTLHHVGLCALRAKRWEWESFCSSFCLSMSILFGSILMDPGSFNSALKFVRNLSSLARMKNKQLVFSFGT